MDEQKTAMQLEADRRARAARGDKDAIEAGEQERSTVKTYPDGSQRVGVPPFPAESPIEEQTAEKRQVANGMVIPPGMKTEGAPTPGPAAGMTPEQFRDKVQEQLDSDVAAGKSPNVVNPTTASTKPELAGTDGHVGESVDLGGSGVSGDNSPPINLEKIASDIKPSGTFEATDEQKAAAVAQVAREVGVPIVKDDRTEAQKRGAGRPAGKTTRK